MSNERVDAPGVGGDVAPPRTRGRPPRINRARIVAAARTIPPETLTMQKVADALGVDPKALNYHVGDRDGLRQLVALDVFEAELRRVKIAGGGDWRDVVRAYVRALREAIIRLGVLAVSLHLPGSEGLGVLEPVESVLQALIGAGLDVDAAGRALAFMTELAYAAGRERCVWPKNPYTLDVAGIAEALKTTAAQDFPILRQVVAVRETATPVELQLEFGLELMIAGLEQLAAKGSREH